MINRSKVRGMLAGVAIGDSLGMPVEGWSADKIKEKYPDGITDYRKPTGHKYFAGLQAGATTDDTQLTRAVLKALIEAGSFDMDTIAKYHILAAEEPNVGWGKTTTEAIRRLQNGVHWSLSGITTEPGRGMGNGVPMKVAPLVLCTRSNDFNQNIVRFSAMTHFSKMSAQAAIIHTHTLSHLLDEKYQPDNFANLIQVALTRWCNPDPAFADYCLYDVSALDEDSGEFTENMLRLTEFLQSSVLWTYEKIHEVFGGGDYLVYHSLPFTYAHFFKCPNSVQSLYSVVNAGGDTDTNGSMLGAMLGAWHGFAFWERLSAKHLLKLPQLEEIISLADQVSEKFGL